MVAAGLRIDFVGDPFGGGLILLGLLSVPVTMVYLVGFANVINLIDGLDGLAAGVTAIAAMSLLVLAAQANRLDAAVLAAALIGACRRLPALQLQPGVDLHGRLGGDVPRLHARDHLAARRDEDDRGHRAWRCRCSSSACRSSTPSRRSCGASGSNRPIHEADRGHIHHRLLGRGFDQRQTVLIIYVWSAALAVGGYAVRYAPGAFRLLAFVVLLALTGFMAYWLGLFEAAHKEPDEHH